MKKVGLYVHIPFCIQKCYYCDFTSYVSNDEVINIYINNLIKEIGMISNIIRDYKIISIFIGGGTPSILSREQLSLILNSIYRELNVSKNIEITLESNPGTLSKDKLSYIYQIGINRLSIGLQSSNDNTLKRIGRIHTWNEFLIQYKYARDVGFQNINIDLIYSLPGEKMKDWKRTISSVIELNPEHISAYSLKIEENTKFYNLYEKKQLPIPSEEEDRTMYHYGIELLKTWGYYQYEISNFCKKGFECTHNKLYWDNEEYIGIGVSSHSYLNSRRFSNTRSLKQYSQDLRNGKLPTDYEEFKTKKDEIFETMFLGLRQNKGIEIKKFNDRFGVNPMDIYKSQIEKLIKLNLLVINDGFIKLTKYGRDVSNQVFLEFIVD